MILPGMDNKSPLRRDADFSSFIVKPGIFSDGKEERPLHCAAPRTVRIGPAGHEATGKPGGYFSDPGFPAGKPYIALGGAVINTQSFDTLFKSILLLLQVYHRKRRKAEYGPSL